MSCTTHLLLPPITPRLQHACVHDACMLVHHAEFKDKSTDRSRMVHWCCSCTDWAQMELLCRKTQGQTTLSHTSFKLTFNGHIISFSPIKFRQFLPNPFVHSVYLRSHITTQSFEWHSQAVDDLVCYSNSVKLTKHSNRKPNRISYYQWRESVCSGYQKAGEGQLLFVCPLQFQQTRWACGFGGVAWTVTCSRSLSSPMTAAVFQSMISEKGSSQPLLSITGTHAAWDTHRWRLEQTRSQRQLNHDWFATYWFWSLNPQYAVLFT